LTAVNLRIAQSFRRGNVPGRGGGRI